VLQTDIKPHEGDWDKLMMLVGRAMRKVEESLVTGHWSVVSRQSSVGSRHSSLVTGHSSLVTGHSEDGRSILVVYPGLMARYGQMGFLETLREEVNRGQRLKSCWLLLPGDNQAMIDGQAVPLIGAGQKVRIPESWLANVHRGQ
jgi:hypothetical protein